MARVRRVNASDLAPIILFVYNRPEHTRRTLAALAGSPLAKDSDLIVYADGPKKPEHAASVVQARDAVRAAEGFRSVKLIERDTNMGLANSIMTGVSEVCGAHGRAIVVEDDLLVAPSFLEFLNGGLRRYQNEPSVLQISGYSYPAHDKTTENGFFLPMVSCWGWATWSRAWAHFDSAMSLLPRLHEDRALRHRFNLDGTYDYYAMACQQAKGQLDSWGIRWQMSLFARDGLVLYPRETLVTNIGADASGTHGAGRPNLQRAFATSGVVKIDWPDTIAMDANAFEQVKQLLVGERPSLFRRIIQHVRS
jgi:hypothetical protein